MLFWILFLFVFVPPTVWAASFFGALFSRDFDGEDAAFLSFMSCVLWLIAIPAVVSWASYASDISKVEAQHHRITVYEERIESLEQRLSDFDYPSKPTISVDADTPWASMVKSLNDAESELARAKDERAIAIRSIRARMRGPMSGVVDFVGLPDGWDES